MLGNLNFGLILMDPTKRRDRRKSSVGFGARLELLAVCLLYAMCCKLFKNLKNSDFLA